MAPGSGVSYGLDAIDVSTDLVAWMYALLAEHALPAFPGQIKPEHFCVFGLSSGNGVFAVYLASGSDVIARSVGRVEIESLILALEI